MISKSSFVSLSAVSVIACALLAACSGGGGGGSNGGGGGGGGGGTPTNSAPNASATTSAGTVAEGQTFSLDASASSDADGDTLTFSWQQVTGTTVSIADNTQTTLTGLVAPEIGADETAEFRVTVSDGTTTDTASVSVTFTNIAQSPAFANAPPLATTAVFPQAPLALATNVATGRSFVGVEGTTTAGTIAFLDIDVDGAGNVIGTDRFGTEFTQPAQLFPLQHKLAAFPGSDLFLVIEETDDRVSLYYDAGGIFQLAATADVTAPCFVADYINPDFLSAGRGPTSPFFFVGQREAGGSYFSISEATGVPTLQLGGSFGDPDGAGNLPSLCAVSPILREDAQNTATLALNLDTNIFGAGDARAPADLPAGVDMEMVYAKQIYLSDQIPFPVGMGFLFTDGEHDGEHRLIFVSVSEAGEILQTTLSWDLGVPVSFELTNFDYDGLGEIMIVTSTSPEAVVFQADITSAIYNSPSTGAPVFGGFPTATGPSFFEIGLGAQASAAYAFGADALFIADTDDSEVRAYGTLNAVP